MSQRPVRVEVFRLAQKAPPKFIERALHRVEKFPAACENGIFHEAVKMFR